MSNPISPKFSKVQLLRLIMQQLYFDILAYVLMFVARCIYVIGKNKFIGNLSDFLNMKLREIIDCPGGQSTV